MNCIYIYKGTTIGNIKELDDFLLSKEKYYTKYGDLVFNTNILIIDRINKLQESSDKLQKEFQKAKRQCVNDEEIFKLKRPFVGVTEFLTGLKDTVTGDYYFPEFIPEEYWSRRFHAWSKGEVSVDKDHNDGFTLDELEILGYDIDRTKSIHEIKASLKVSPIPLGNIQDWKNSKGEYIENFGTTLLKDLKAKIENKWKAQVEFGNSVHAILQDLFTKGEDGLYRIDNLDLDFFKKYKLEKTKLDSIINYALDLRKLFPESDFFPELAINTDLDDTYEGRKDLKLLGRIDLLVVNPDGKLTVIDYKTSPKQYDDYSSAKKLTYTYLLHTYKKMLAKNGFYSGNIDVFVAPITLKDFKFNNNLWEYSSISNLQLEDLNWAASNEKINNNLNNFIEPPMLLSVDSDKTISNVLESMELWFSGVNNRKLKTREEVKLLMEDLNSFTPNSDSGMYEFYIHNSSKPVIAKDPETLFRKVYSIYNDAIKNNAETTRIIRNTLKKVLKGESYEISSVYDSWFNDKLSKYINGGWTVVEGESTKVTDEFGIIILENKLLDLVDVITITPNNVKYQNSWNKNKNLTGNFEPDIKENSQQSLMLPALNGNITLMETMLVLNSLNFNTPIRINEIKVIHPGKSSDGITASNKELLYCWQRLNSFKPVSNTNKYKTGQIKMLSKAESCYLEYQDIMNRLNDSKQTLFKQFESCFNQLILNINNKDLCLIQLIELSKKLESTFIQLNKDIDKSGKSIHLGITGYDKDYERILYQKIQAAILEVSGLDIKQIHKDGKSYIENVNIFTQGLQGLMLDNPGNFSNDMLNKITQLALEGYQNARDPGYRRINQLRLRTEKLKKSLGFAGFVEHTYGNLTSLYQGMTKFTENGEFRFINPWKNSENLSPELTDYLKFVILEIAKDVHPNWSNEQLQQHIENDSRDLFEVPLIEASFASKVNTAGWLGWLKNKFKRLSSKKEIIKLLKDLNSKYLDEETEQSYLKDLEIFKVVNMMEQGRGDARKRIIEDKLQYGQSYAEAFFERDLERILSNHIWAFETKRALEDRMVLMKAAFVTLAVAGNDLNMVYENDLDYFKKFIQNKINHLSIDPENLKSAKAVVSTIQQVCSWLTLAFSPLLFTYQSVQKIWNDIKLIITKPDGDTVFTSKNMWKASKLVYRELAHVSDIPSVIEAVNALYGINDMDNASFALNNISNRHGFFNWWNRLAYKFSSRPDFYSRMTIFVAQMLKDGNYYAHSIDKDGNLVYDETKDERFKVYTTNKEGKNIQNLEEYNKAKALYFATAKQLVAEGVRMKDGSLFTIGKPLPKAYSNKESEARKAIGDTIYGYYDSTKKSLLGGTFLGALALQMKTYWSSKKNQYFGAKGNKAQGKWVHAEEILLDKEGKPVLDEQGNPVKVKMYYPKLKNGEIDYYSLPVPETDPNRSDEAYLLWKGKYEEGIILTMWGWIKEAISSHSFTGNFQRMSQGDEDVYKTYIANRNILIFDLIAYYTIGNLLAGLLGDWADDEEKEFKKDPNLYTATWTTAANLIYRTIYNSSLDFNALSSIFEPAVDWNPFAVSYTTREIKNIGNLITGDASFSETAVKSMSAARQFKPYFELLNTEE